MAAAEVKSRMDFGDISMELSSHSGEGQNKLGCGPEEEYPPADVPKYVYT